MLPEHAAALVERCTAGDERAWAELVEAYTPLLRSIARSHRLDDGHIEGEDPLAPFGIHAPEFVARVAHRPEAPDIYVNSLVDPGTEEVAAFEGLVGCHGGLGGWQDRAMVVVPADLPFPTDRVIGADAMHVALCGILRHCGHRQGVAYDGAAPVHVTEP